MKAIRSRSANHLFCNRRKRPLKSATVQAHWLDVWLPRISHFSQFGLFAITIGSLYFTVLPLYQKAVLEEAIARKEVELAASEKSLEQSYSRVRGFAVKEFVFSTGAECSGLMLPPRALQALGEKPLPRPTEAEEILNINASECLKAAFQKASNLKQLRSNDLQTIHFNIERIATDLKLKRDAAWQEYESIPERAKTDPLILKPLGSYSERMLTFLSKTQSPSQVDATRFSIAVKETQATVARQYAANIRNQIASLRSIEWGALK